MQLSQFEQFVQLMLPLASRVRPEEFITTDRVWESAGISAKDPSMPTMDHEFERDCEVRRALVLARLIEVTDSERSCWVGIAEDTRIFVAR